jgi:pyruvate formate lyase activating enzyme
MNGLIFNIKKFAVHDGPGIRVTFFMKGCPLNCRWCHNPEGISPDNESVDHTDKVGENQFKRTEVVGKYFSSEDVIAILEREKVFIDHSIGGVTFSGGEPMMQPEFLLETLMASKNAGFHTAVDTSGFASAMDFKKIIPFTDLFLFDIKHMNEARHIEYTGVSNILILDNYRLLVSSGTEIVVRFPVIPGFNDDNDHLIRLKDFLTANSTYGLKEIDLLPYHKTGSSKYKIFNRKNMLEDLDQPTNEKMLELKKFFAEFAPRVKIGG